MTNKIEQEFLINASQALNMLGQLDTGFQKFEDRLKSTARAIADFNSGASATGAATMTAQLQAASSAMNALQVAATAAAPAVAGVGGRRAQQPLQQTTGLLEQMANMTNKAGVSFETLARIIQAQVVVRSINAIRDALLESVDSAGKLQQQIALVETIATAAPSKDGKRIGVGTEKITSATKDISDTFNIPQLQVAEGLYNAISNQVGDYSESLLFTVEAAKLARAANSTLAESVDTVSAVLRSYRLNADQSARIGDILFATVDKGRVTLDELSSTLGRVLPAAATLGISFEEISAAVATISVGGLSADETLTQVRASISGLLKPSDALKEKYEELGIASGAVGVRTYGFVGFLNMLRESTGGSTTALAKLFPNVRNLGGVLALTAEQATLFDETLHAITNTVGLVDKSFDIVTGTDFEQLTSTANKAKNAMTELGHELISSLAGVQRFVGGADSVVIAIEVMARGAIAAVPVLVGLGATMVATSNAARVLTLALKANPLVLWVTAASSLTVGLIQLSKLMQSMRVNAVSDTLTALKDFDAKKVAQEIAAMGRETTTASRAFDQGLSISLKGAAAASKEYMQIMPALKSGNEDFVTSIESALGSVVKARQDYVRELDKAAKDASKLIDSSKGRVDGLQSTLREGAFDRSIKNLNDANKVYALTERSSKLANQAAQELASAARLGDDRGMQRAQALFDRAGQLASEAESIAESTDNRALQAKAVGAITSALNKQIGAEQVLQQLSRARAEALKVEQKRQEEIALGLKKQAKIVLDNTSLFDNQGKAFSQDDLAKRATLRNDAMGKLLEAQFDRGDFNLANILGMADFTRSFEKELSGLTADISVTLDNRGQSLADEVSRVLGEFNADPFVQALKRAAGIALTEILSPEDLERISADATEKFRNSRLAESEKRAADSRAADAKKQMEDALRMLDTLQEKRKASSNFGLDGENPLQRNVASAVESFKTQMREMIDSGAGADALNEKFKGLATTLGEVQKANNFWGSGVESQFEPDAVAVGALKDALKAYTEESLKAEAATDKIKSVGDANFEGIINAGTAAGNLQTNLNLGVQAANNQALAMSRVEQSALRAAQAVSAALSGGGGVHASFGGFFANGGVTRGVDNIPAMLTAGESVLNPSATARFYSQIQAMNAGQSPVYRSQGGPVTNIGDINVNVSTTGGGVDGKQIAESLRRELRRNSNSLQR